MTRLWLKGIQEDLSGLTIPFLAQKVGGWIVQECHGRPALYGLNLHGRTIDPEVSEVFTEIIKIHVFIASYQKLFARSVHISKHHNQVLVDIVDSEPDRSRNYLARKAGDAAKIPYDIVQIATAFSVAFNAGALPMESAWYPPVPIKFPFDIQRGHMFQLLVIIFTLERVFPVWDIDPNGHWFVKIHPFNVISGGVFFGGMYEHYLVASLNKQ